MKIEFIFKKKIVINLELHESEKSQYKHQLNVCLFL